MLTNKVHFKIAFYIYLFVRATKGIIKIYFAHLFVLLKHGSLSGGYLALPNLMKDTDKYPKRRIMR